MDAETAAQRWADTWSRAWPQRDAEAIAALYGDMVVYRSPCVPPAGPGPGWRPPLSRRAAPGREKYLVLVRQADRLGDRAAVEWWASWTEQGQELTYAGVTALHFDDQGQVVEHRDYDNHVERREPPCSGW